MDFSHIPVCCAKSCQSCPTFCDSVDYSLPGSSVHGDSPGKNTGVGCHVLLQGMFLTQRSNPRFLCPLRWQAGSLPLCYLGSPCVYICTCIYTDLFPYLQCGQNGQALPLETAPPQLCSAPDLIPPHLGIWEDGNSSPSVLDPESDYGISENLSLSLLFCWPCENECNKKKYSIWKAENQVFSFCKAHRAPQWKHAS